MKSTHKALYHPQTKSWACVSDPMGVGMREMYLTEYPHLIPEGVTMEWLKTHYPHIHFEGYEIVNVDVCIARLKAKP